MLKGESTTEFEPVLAESWQASADNLTFTFKIPAGRHLPGRRSLHPRRVGARLVPALPRDGPGPGSNVIARFMPDASDDGGRR